MDISSMIIDPIPKKVPRPLNCFMTYRLEKQREILQQFPGTNHRDISKITAKWWKEMSVAEKEPYRIKAFNAKYEHEKKYPDYKFNPKKKLTKTRAYKKRTDESYSLQDIEQKQRLYTLYHEGMKSIKKEPTEKKGEICCANCYSSSNNNCFKKNEELRSFQQKHNDSFRLPVIRQTMMYPTSNPLPPTFYYHLP